MAMLEVVVGTYEELLLGYKVDLNDEDLKFEQSFTDHSHIGCVKSVAVSRKGMLASGSTDEVIRLFSLKHRKELGCLMQHEGSVSNLEFFGKTHLFSSSEDGSICVFKIKKWECVRTLRGHKGPIHSFAIHPTGKMALSVSRDRSMKTWNLMTGRRAYTTNTKLAADLVQWSPDGTKYLIATNNKLDIYSMETSKVVKTILYDSRIYVLTFAERNTLVVAGEGGNVHFYNLNTFEKEHEISTETNRIRGASIMKHNDYHLLATASSDGTLQLWKITHSEESWTSEKLLSKDTKFRLTCLGMTIHKPKPTTEAAEESLEDGSDVDEELEESDEEVEESDEEEEEDGSDNSNASDEETKDEPTAKAKKRKITESNTITKDFQKAPKKSKKEHSKGNHQNFGKNGVKGKKQKGNKKTKK